MMHFPISESEEDHLCLNLSNLYFNIIYLATLFPFIINQCLVILNIAELMIKMVPDLKAQKKPFLFLLESQFCYKLRQEEQELYIYIYSDQSFSPILVFLME